jgi:hypothetical protein
MRINRPTRRSPSAGCFFSSSAQAGRPLSNNVSAIPQHSQLQKMPLAELQEEAATRDACMVRYIREYV